MDSALDQTREADVPRRLSGTWPVYEVMGVAEQQVLRS